MSKNQLAKEKSCIFYSGDFHFEMISLPYISKKMDENKKIVILNENDLEDTINLLISKLNLKEEKKAEILKLNWSNNINNKLNNIKDNINKGEEVVIFIKGSIEFIKKQNEKIIELKNQEKINVVDCYEIQNAMNNLGDIKNKYTKVINTVGERQI